jgi:hypothetical protein
MSARAASHVACRIGLILAPAGGWLMGGKTVDTAIAGHFYVELLNVSAPDRVVDLGKLIELAGDVS